MGWLSDKLFGKRKTLDINKIKQYLAPTQGLVNAQGNMIGNQLGISQDLMNPYSAMNQRMTNMISQQGYNTGEQIGQSVARTGAMTGASNSQTMMQQRMAMLDSMSGVNDKSLQYLNNRFDAGTGLLGQGIVNTQRQSQQQLGMDESEANAYMAQINASNAARQQNMGMGMNLLGSVMASDRKLKTNINLIGKSPKGLNIYEFDYKNKYFGKGRYKGVMAQEVPNSALKRYAGYLFVDYDKVDVNFERVK